MCAQINTEHFTASSVLRTYASKKEALEHAVEVVQGFLEVSDALGYAVVVVAEVSIYASDFLRQLKHPVFKVFTKALLSYARKGKLFIQGSMGGGRAVSDAIVPLLLTRPIRDSSGEMKALLAERFASPYGGADASYDICEDHEAYAELGNAACRVRPAGAALGARRSSCPTCWAGLLGLVAELVTDSQIDVTAWIRCEAYCVTAARCAHLTFYVLGILNGWLVLGMARGLPKLSVLAF